MTPPVNRTRAALRYAALGLRVHPLAPAGKRPLTKWKASATADPAQVRELFDKRVDPDTGEVLPPQFPDANIGVCVPAGHVVLDVDTADAMNWIRAMDYVLPSTATQRTPRGGWHLWYRLPEGVELRQGAGQIAPGVDTRTARGYVVAAPSRVVYPDDTEGKYRWEGGGPFPEAIAECPEWIITATEARASSAAAPPHARTAPGGSGDIGVFNASVPTSHVLAEAGYPCVESGELGDGVVARHIAPGSTSGTAGVVVFEDGRCFSHHSREHDPLADGHAHDAFGVYTLLVHGGDARAAMKAAARGLGIERRRAS